jgi:hypothetical protein
MTGSVSRNPGTYLDKFNQGFELLIGGTPKGIEAAPYCFADPDQIETHTTKARIPTQWFVCIGLSTSMRDWKPYVNAHKQLKDGFQPPQASLNLSRQLFKECESIRNSLLEKLYTSNTKEATETHQDAEDPSLDLSSPHVAKQSSASRHPAVTPSALTIEEDEVEMTTTPFLDGFVGTRDKNNKTKLAGILKETVATLAPGQHDRSLKITSVNGAEKLLSMIPQSKTESGFVQAAHRSNWLTDVLGHVRSSDADGASSVARYIVGKYQEQFLTVAKEDAGLTPMESMDTIASEAMIQDANLTVSQFKLVQQHVTFAAGNSFNMRYARPVFKELEGAQSGPVPIFGVYKNKNENGSVEHCKHWLTLIGDEASFAVENQILNCSKNTKPMAIGSLFPKEVEVVVGLDHGQGAMRGFAKVPSNLKTVMEREK